MAIEGLTLLRPLSLLLLLPLPVLLWLFARGSASQRAWAQACDAHLLPHLLVGTGLRSRRWPLLLFALGWVLACLALAGPAWERQTLPVLSSSAARVLVVDLSSNMWAADLPPSRMARTRMKLLDLLDVVREGQTGLLVFAEDAYIVSPLTDDVNTLRGQIEVLDPGLMPVSGYRPERGLALAVELLERGDHPQGDILLLLSDHVPSSLNSAVRAARARGMRVSVWMVGTEAGGPVPLPSGGFVTNPDGQIRMARPDGGAQRALAAAGGGGFFPMVASDRDVDDLAASLLAAGNPLESDAAREAGEVWLDRGPWLILLLLPVAALAFRRGWLLALPLAVVLLPQPALAFEWRDWFQKPDRRAAQALAQGDHERARALARDPALAAAAAYRGGDFEAAADAFAEGDSATAHYNRGNALARQGQYQEALEAYDQALQRQADHQDALANREAIEQWLQQQPPSEQQQGEGESDEEQETDNDQDSEADQQQSEDQQGEQQDSDDGEQSDAEQGEHDDQQDGDGDQRAEQDQAEQQLSEDEAAEAREQLREALDQALEEDGEAAQAGEASHSHDEQRDALEQWLRRVPDDPGGLLRAKFRLEHQRRAAERSDGRSRQ